MNKNVKEKVKENAKEKDEYSINLKMRKRRILIFLFVSVLLLSGSSQNLVSNNSSQVKRGYVVQNTSVSSLQTNITSKIKISEFSGGIFKNTKSNTLIKAPVQKMNMATTSIGDVNMLVFMVDFADVKYKKNVLDINSMNQVLFGDGTFKDTKVQSLNEYYNEASYGNLDVQGDVYHYTAKGKIKDYEEDSGYERLIMEIMDYYNKQINYTDYDKNVDGYIDGISISVPSGGNADFWYGFQGTWYLNPEYSVDGEKVKQFIVNDGQPYQSDILEYISILEHELGHSMGLPDYYLYDSSDWEGYHGKAGYERMEDALGDFSSFSKIMLGWLKQNEIKVANTKKGKSTYSISSASKHGSCLILPIGKWKNDYSGEYFLVEYITPENNNKGLFLEGGIRIFHINANMVKDYYGNCNFKYEEFSEKYDKSHKGIRITRLVNDGKGFLKSGDIVRFGTSNFAGYDKRGKQAINTGYEIKIGDLVNGKYTIHVIKHK